MGYVFESPMVQICGELVFLLISFGINLNMSDVSNSGTLITLLLRVFAINNKVSVRLFVLVEDHFNGG